MRALEEIVSKIECGILAPTPSKDKTRERKP